jgi:hypothetical protein
MKVLPPIAFIVFNRPDKTARVLAEIAKAKPGKLFVIADGPRTNYPDDVEKCSAVRKLINQVDWECEVLKNYSDVNLGCGLRPATGIRWVFEHVEEAIILEDDCVPHPTFFRFCKELLEKYRKDRRMMMIGGFNIYEHCSPYSYSFSRIPVCAGGWATWRRAWQYWDRQMKLWPALRDTSWLFDILGDKRVVEEWQNIFTKAYSNSNTADYWDYQWAFACWAQSGLSILPTTVNLLSNIGFDEEATHTKLINDRRANLPTAEIIFPLQHPPYAVRDREADKACIERLLLPAQPQQGLYWQLRRRFSAAIPGGLRQRVAYLRTVLRWGRGQ